MTLFLKRACLFSLPIIVTAVCLEVYIKSSESAYLLKSSYFKGQEYEGIVLGSSHNQNAINPEYFSMKTCNVAMGSQDLKTDLLLLKKSIEHNPNLKYVILEMSYHRFRENPKNYWRNSINEYFYDINVSKEVNFSKYFLLSSNLKFFRNFFGQILSSRKHVYNYNQFGFDKNDFDGIFKQMNYDEKKIIQTAKKRLRSNNRSGPDSLVILRAVSYLKKINEICIKNNIRLVLVAPPVYKTYSNEFREFNLNRRSKIIDLLYKVNPNLLWLNFEKSNSFNINHFKNDDHLNANGARLFTTMLNDSLKQLNR